jgi:hypothetical protein
LFELVLTLEVRHPSYHESEYVRKERRHL